MNHVEIMNAAMAKAYSNGWGYWNGEDTWDVEKEKKYHWEKAVESDPNGGRMSYWANIVFDHDFAFAKALWGTEDTYLDVEAINPEIGGHFDSCEQPPLPMYKKHLMMMAVADDPIAYLGEHI